MNGDMHVGGVLVSLGLIYRICAIQIKYLKNVSWTH